MVARRWCLVVVVVAAGVSGISGGGGLGSFVGLNVGVGLDAGVGMAADTEPMDDEGVGR